MGNRSRQYASWIALGAITALGLAGCAGAGSSTVARSAANSASATPSAVASLEKAASACTASGGTWDGTSCTTPAREAADPNGESCASLDSLGYCPGDDPSPMQQWCNGDGDSDFQAVQSDLDQLSTDSSNEDLTSVESDGATLAQDAEAAVKNLPPASKTQKLDYGLYMGYVSVAGLKLTNGDLSGADSAFAKSTQYKNTAFNLANQCNS